jgi:hypothetical protein
MPDLDRPERAVAGVAASAATGIPGIGFAATALAGNNGVRPSGGAGMSLIGDARAKIDTGNDLMDEVEQHLEEAKSKAEDALANYNEAAEDSNQPEAEDGKQQAQAVIDAIEELQGQSQGAKDTLTGVGQRF